MLEYCFAISGFINEYPFLMGMSYPLLFCMGPFYFIYVQSQFKNDFRFTSKQLVHFIVPVLCLLLMLPFYLTPAAEKLKFISSLEQDGVLQIPAGQYLFMVLHILQTAFYFYLAYRLIQKTDIHFRDAHSNPVFSAKINYMKGFSIVFLAWLAVYFLTTLFLFISKKYHVEIDYGALLITSALMFVFNYTVLKNPSVFNETIVDGNMQEEFRQPGTRQGEAAREEKIEPNTNTLMGAEISTARYKNSILTPEKISEIKEQLENYFTSQKPWLKYDLKLPEVAKALSIPSYQISQVINQEYNLNFFDFINKYRVDEAKKLLGNKQQDNEKLMAIALDAGFNSKATFNRVFKKFTGLTPSEYRKISLEKQGITVSAVQHISNLKY